MTTNTLVYIASLVTASTVILTAVSKLWKLVTRAVRAINEFTELIRENTMYTLKLVILNEQLSLDERIHAGERYVQLHGNGDVYETYQKLLRKKQELEGGLNHVS